MNKPKYSAVTLLIAVALVAVGWAAAKKHSSLFRETEFFGSDGLKETEPILEKYGSQGRSSRNTEEWLIRDYFQDRRNGIFLDVGANDYRNESNTYYLETQLGWSGVAIDALPEFATGYREHRPRTQFFALFASDVADSTARLFVPETNKLVASVSREFTEDQGARGVAQIVPTTTLDAVLGTAGISRLDFMSMDIELSEPKALAGFDIDRFRPALVCIEGHREVRQQILDYFARHGYTLVGRYLRMDPTNLYFMRLSS